MAVEATIRMEYHTWLWRQLLGSSATWPWMQLLGWSVTLDCGCSRGGEPCVRVMPRAPEDGVEEVSKKVGG